MDQKVLLSQKVPCLERAPNRDSSDSMSGTGVLAFKGV